MLFRSLLATIYAIASLAQLVVGGLIDRMAFKQLQWWISEIQVPILIVAAHTRDWWLFFSLLAVMIFVFGSIPFTDAMIVRYVDDRLRSRVTGMRLAIGFGVSSLVTAGIGPSVKEAGFPTLLLVLAGVACITTLMIAFLPSERQSAMAALKPAE